MAAGSSPVTGYWLYRSVCEAGEIGGEELKLVFPFICCPMIPECSVIENPDTVKKPKKQTNNKQKQPSRGVLKKRVLKICSKFSGEHPCPAWVLSCKFAAYFQNTFC